MGISNVHEVNVLFFLAQLDFGALPSLILPYMCIFTGETVYVLLHSL